MKKILILAILPSLFLLSCQKTLVLNQDVWTGNSKSQKPIFKNAEFTKPHSSLKYSDEVVQLSFQKIGNAIIAGSALNTIFDANGKEIFIRSTWQQGLDGATLATLEAKSKELDTKKYAVLEMLKQKSPYLANAQEIFPPQLVVEKIGNHFSFFYSIDFIDKAGLNVYRMRANDKMGIESLRRVESCFTEARSLVFPAGPKLSDLRQEILKNLIGDGTLSSTMLSLSSADGAKVSEPNNDFFYETDDLRFDQVQAFFFVQKTLQYADKNWGLTLPSPLKVQLRTGFPQKTNAAFYYQGLIRLGDGDGNTYRHIPRDPSIVSHEVSHSIIDRLSGMSPEGESGSINEGFADFLTASVWENPHLGHTAFVKAPFKRTVENELTYKERNGGLYHDSAIISGLFWKIRTALGANKSQALAIKTIARLGANPDFSMVRFAVTDAAKTLEFEDIEIAQLTEAMDKRALP